MHRPSALIVLLTLAAPAGAATVNASPSTVVVAAPGNLLKLNCAHEGAAWTVIDPPRVAGVRFPAPALVIPAEEAWRALGGGALASARVACEAPGHEPQTVTVEFLGMEALGGDLIIPQTMLEVTARQRYVAAVGFTAVQTLGVIDPVPLSAVEAYRRHSTGFHFLTDRSEPKPSVVRLCSSELNALFKCPIIHGDPVGESGSPYLNTGLLGMQIGSGYSEDVTGDYLGRVTVSRDPLMPSDARYEVTESGGVSNGENLERYPGAVHGDVWIHVEGSRSATLPYVFVPTWRSQELVQGAIYEQLPYGRITMAAGALDFPVASLIYSYTPPVRTGLAVPSSADFSQMELLALYQVQGTTLIRAEVSGRKPSDQVRLLADGKGRAVLYAAFRYNNTGQIGEQLVSVFID